MPLNEVWFVLIAVLFTGFFFLEGFDFGVGMATRLLPHTDGERRVLINTIGPFWDANEVWLITAAGAMFAAFPHWYATMFSGYYVLLSFILLALIFRGVAFEFRGKVDKQAWRGIWDTGIFIGSCAPPLLFGMLFASMVKGVPIGPDMEMVAGFSDIVNGYSIWGGVTVVGLCLLHGLTFISLRTVGEIRMRARRLALKLLPVQMGLLVVFTIWTYAATDLFEHRQVFLIISALLGSIVCILAGYFMRKGREGWAFTMTGSLIVLTFSSLFIGLSPRLMVSSIDSAFNLTLQNAASSPYTLQVMTVVAAVLLPFVLAYQVWSYFVFHKRVTEKDHLEY
ncbi:cytochrome d ubiquinol oxidase subunit II [Paenibacillus agricola]|uniref:Cytochrome d ubiquinol oxidase subunit II n=1 Tax=Paenibacillus agricola TaxID=2716264 RepID=A0ABX0J0C5_9BACL|nr:cytochrome d ubiquinol oxidase subunit II [Paenibacillus agricola]NHN28876.1 cytochrome d ubiquinol oxidase subunit II [Paenibacillus agricola]